MVLVQPTPAGSMHPAHATSAALLSPSRAQHHLFSPPPDSPGHSVHVLSFILWKHHSNKLFFFFHELKRNRQQKKHKYTNSCVLGPRKRSDCFVRWMWPGLGTLSESSPSLVLFGVINIARLLESGFTFTGMAEGTLVTLRPPSCWNTWGS